MATSYFSCNLGRFYSKKSDYFITEKDVIYILSFFVATKQLNLGALDYPLMYVFSACYLYIFYSFNKTLYLINEL